ncbi:hypothetical protein ACLOJK_041891 [Asimina triloba]
MSILQYPNTISSPNAKIYNNAAFDDASDEVGKASWAPLQSIPIPIQALDSNSSKENRSPVFCPSTGLAISQPPDTRISQGKPLKLLFKQGLLSPPPPIEPTKLDAEIEDIEKEISRLSSRLEALRIEKTSREPKTVDRRQSIGSIVPAKFMEPKQSSAKKIQESPATLRRRGVSLGPSEIASGVRLRQAGKAETATPGHPNRRKSYFLKLPEIEEEKGRSRSLSPKSRPSVKKLADPRRGISTVGSKKPGKREEPTLLTCIHPKKLFNGGDDPCPSKKPSKNSRIVPSRYGQTPEPTVTANRRLTRGQGATRTPRASKEGGGKRSSMEHSPSSITRVAEALPKLRTVRCEEASPRDSGQAKRVADLVGRASFFGSDDVASSVCTVLGFEEE